MKALATVFVLSIILFGAASATATGGDTPQTLPERPPQLARGTYGIITSDQPVPGKARQDTLYLVGGPDDASGTFETPGGAPSWYGWTHHDPTAPTETHWHASTYWGNRTGANPGADNQVAYCGDETIEPCDPGDAIGGYGDNWVEWMEWYGTVPDPSQPTDVTVDYYISYDNEPDYDYVYLRVSRQTGFETLRTYNGIANNVHEQVDFTVNVADYIGVGNDQVRLRFAFASDAGWSDEDCIWPTHGACQIDDVTVSFNDQVASYDDFEGGGLGSWETFLAPGVGDFTALRRGLADIDPCNSNDSWQVTFVDDGEVVDGTGGTECVSWCYGPDGYIVNNTGGLVGPAFHIQNQIISEVIVWPGDNYDGARLVFNVYRHEELGEEEIWPGIFYQWFVRSVNTGDPDDLEEADWANDNLVLYGGPDYLREAHVVTPYLEAGRTHVQVMMQCVERGYVWGWVGTDGTPAPYFDNLTLLAYTVEGPSLSTREIDIAQDTFPDRGSIDYGNLVVNSCRFDMGRDINQALAGLVFGDSIVVNVNPLRAGAQLTGPPRLYYLLDTNPLFNGVRGSDLGTPDASGRISGYVEGWVAELNGVPQEGVYAFDLPDTGVFYPGDVLHYLIWAEDAVDGVTDPQTATLPADTTGFSDFSGRITYQLQSNANFTVNFLPTLFSATAGDQPKILFWNDFANRGGQQEWHTALRNNGFLEGEHFDVYYTNGPDSGVGNGLGGLASPVLLEGYDILLYSCGNLSAFTISPPNPEDDEGDDTGVLAAWFEFGNKNAFFTGDDLAYDLNANAISFLNTWLGIDWRLRSVASFIDQQTTPMVLATNNNPIFSPGSDRWIAYGGCPVVNTFDGVDLRGNSETIAEFASPGGDPGGYTYPAGVYHYDAGFNNRTVYLPYDLLFIDSVREGGKQVPAPLPARALVLRDVLIAFGQAPGPGVDVPEALAFAAVNYPNPFNPNTTIAFTLPRAGTVTVKIYSVRGELVRTLIDDVRYERGQNAVVWEGDDDQSGQVASGVYFYEVRSGGHRMVDKMALVK